MAISLAIGRVGFDLVRWGTGPYQVGELDPALYPLLSGVDPVGDTLFNQRQIPRVLEEVEQLLSAPECSGQARDSLERIRDLLSVRLAPHEFLWLVGD